MHCVSLATLPTPTDRPDGGREAGLPRPTQQHPSLGHKTCAPWGMDEHGTYSLNERREYQPPPCPSCGSLDVAVSWINATSAASPPGDERFIPGEHRCRSCGGWKTN